MASQKRFMLAGLVGLFLVGHFDKPLQVQNGELPDAVVPFVKPLLGQYTVSGSWNLSHAAERGLVALELQGKRLVLRVLTPGLDLIHSGCGSSPGQLVSMRVTTEQNGEFASGTASFALNPGSCHVTGDTLNFKFGFGFTGHDMELNIADGTRYIPSGPHGSVGRNWITWSMDR